MWLGKLCVAVSALDLPRCPPPAGVRAAGARGGAEGSGEGGGRGRARAGVAGRQAGCCTLSRGQRRLIAAAPHHSISDAAGGRPAGHARSLLPALQAGPDAKKRVAGDDSNDEVEFALQMREVVKQQAKPHLILK